MQTPPSDDYDRGVSLACLTIYFLILSLAVLTVAVWGGLPWVR